MIETELMMNDAGWLDNDGVTNSQLDIQSFHPTVYKTGSEWRNIVKQCRENLLNVKKKIIHQLQVQYKG